VKRGRKQREEGSRVRQPAKTSKQRREVHSKERKAVKKGRKQREEGRKERQEAKRDRKQRETDSKNRLAVF
jgi:hypothetical protein